MNKQEWKQPELMELGVQGTQEEAGTLEGERWLYHCQYCGNGFATYNGKKKHEETCFSKPAAPDNGNNAVEIPGLEPTFS